jgi:hypothetical protein
MAKAPKKHDFKPWPPGTRTHFGVPTTDRDFPDWHVTPGTYIAGREHLDDLDMIAVKMEEKWGRDRLRLLVDRDLREKFDRQRYKTNQAIWKGNLQDVKIEADRMMKAWRALDRAAEAAGQWGLATEVWEAVTPDGTVVAVVRNDLDLRKVVAEGRHVEVYTMSEVARLLANYPTLATVKASFPGCQVERVSGPPRDPLDAIPDSKAPIDDPCPF